MSNYKKPKFRHGIIKVKNHPIFKEVIKWIGEERSMQEKGIDEKTGNTLIEIDPKYYRPTEVDSLLGDPTKAIKKLGWNPKETSFEKLVEIMVKHDIKLVENEIRIKQSYE
mgnify:CR=1 FL=1